MRSKAVLAREESGLPHSSPFPSEGEGSSLWEKRIVAALIAFTLLATSLPYLLGYFLAPVMGPGGSQSYFVGTAYNIDDYCNYLSWLRQMADGHFFLRNLFTTEPQKGLEFNVFFWLLGRLMALTHCSPQIALQVARVGGGAGLLWLIYRFYRHCLPDNLHARLTAFGFACLGSGFGWAQWHVWQDKNLGGSPVDAWQPEAYTFLSIYTSALMTVSTMLILGALYALLLGERTGQWKYPIIAGVCGGILGNMHSYDVLHLSAAWGLFLVVWTIVKRGHGVAQSWLRAVVALTLTLPTTLYMYYVFNAEAVFHKRAEVKTLSPEFWHYMLGYGIVFALAVVAAGVLLVRHGPPTPNSGGGGPEIALSPAPTIRGGGIVSPLLFALCWAVGGLLVIYLPFAFQRKMLMGEHIPLCLLAGVGASWLAVRFKPRVQAATLALLVLAAAPSNALFLKRDLRHLATNKSETHLAPFLDPALIDVYDWLRANTPATAAIVGFPGLCTYLPGEAGRAVWAGHWAETPSYGTKDTEFTNAFDSQTSDADRRAFLVSTRAQYLFYPNDLSQETYRRHGEARTYVELSHAVPPYLTSVYANKSYTVYAIR